LTAAIHELWGSAGLVVRELLGGRCAEPLTVISAPLGENTMAQESSHCATWIQITAIILSSRFEGTLWIETCFSGI